ncbi:MAG: ATP-binding protein [Bacteroidaceae bacterium]|nr:ATP-binding protein [Bacteroidaceae bacterium]
MSNIFADKIFKVGTKISIRTINEKYQGVIETVSEDSIVLSNGNSKITIGERVLNNLTSISIITQEKSNKNNSTNHFYAPFEQVSTNGLLPAMGRIMEINNKFGYIADVNSHEKLFFYKAQLLEDYLHYQSDKLLIGTPVLYCIKKTSQGDGFEARSIIRPKTYEEALRIADSYKDTYPLNSLALLRVVEKFHSTNAIKNRIALLLRKPSVAERMWAMIELPTNCNIGNKKNTKTNRSIEAKESLTANAFIVSFSGKRGSILCNEEYYYFTNWDIIEENFINTLDNFNQRNLTQRQIPICCTLDNETKKASYIFRPISIHNLFLFVERKIRVRDFNAARAIVNYALNNFPDNPRLLQIEQEIVESVEQANVSKVLAPNSLNPCGLILNKKVKISPKRNLKKGLAKFAEEARMNDLFCSKKVKYRTEDIIDSELLADGVSYNTPVMYQLIKHDSIKDQYMAKFIHRVLPVDDAMFLAMSLYKEGKIVEAWGVAKCILDQRNNNKDVLLFMKKCEEADHFVRPNTVELVADIALSRKYKHEKRYKEAIDAYIKALENGAIPDLCVCDAIDSYNEYIKSLDNYEQITIAKHDKSCFADRYLPQLSHNDNNLRYKIKYYSTCHEHRKCQEIYRELLNIATYEGINEEIASIWAGMAKEAMLSNEDKKIVNDYVVRAERTDKYCTLAKKCSSILQLENLLYYKSSQYPHFSVFPLSELCDKINKFAQSGYISDETQRLLLLKESANTNDIKRSLTILNSYISSVLHTRSYFDDNNINELSFYDLCFNVADTLLFAINTKNISEYDLWLISEFSPLCSQIIVTLLYKVAPEYAINLIQENGKDFLGIANILEYIREFDNKRQSVYEKIKTYQEISKNGISTTDYNDILYTIKNFSAYQRENEIDNSYNNTLIDDIYPRIQKYFSADNSKEHELSYRDLQRLINKLHTQIKNHPTLISVCFYLPILEHLTSLIKHHHTEFSLQPECLKLSIVSVSATNETGAFLVELELLNEGKKSTSIMNPQLEILTSESIKECKYDSFKKCIIYGDHSTYFVISIIPSKIENNHTNGYTIKTTLRYEVKGEIKTFTKEFGRISPPQSYKSWLGRNPYTNFGKRVEDSNMFFGRESTIDTIYSTLCPVSNNNIPDSSIQYWLYGQKRCGKSSVLYHLSQKLNNNDRAFCVEMSFLNVTSESQCYYKILDAINIKLSNIREEAELGLIDENPSDIPDFALPEEFSNDTFALDINKFKHLLIEFKRSLRKSSSVKWRNKELVVLIDEFSSVYNAIKSSKNSINSGFIKNWRELQELSETRFATVMICQDVMYSLMKEHGNVNDFAIYNPERLTYLEDKYAKLLITKPIIDISGNENFFHKDAVNQILYYTANSAYYTVIFCKSLLEYADNYRLSTITKEDVDRVAFQVVNSEIIKKDKFDALLLAGESDIVSRYSKNTVRGIVDQIARMELSSGECFIDKIHYINPDTKQDDVEYRDGILSDLEERSVIRKNGKKCSINIKLYTLWIKTQL